MKRPLWIFIFVFIATRALLLAYLVYGQVGLLPDEAQYWTWSRELNIGYYSKPPGIAWQIALSEYLSPEALNADAAVRFLSFTLWPLASALAIAGTLLCLTRSRAFSYSIGALYFITPVGFLGSLFATTDGALVAMTCAANFFFCRSVLEEENLNRPLLYAAISIAIGALWKWTSYLSYPILLYLCFRKKRDPRTGLGIITIPLLGLIPSLIWNAQHNWVTFRHVEASLQAVSQSGGVKSFLEFFIGSSALPSWAVTAIALYGIRQMRSAPPKERLFLSILLAEIIFIWGGLLGYSYFSRMQGNWALAAAPAVFIFFGMGVRSMQPKTAAIALSFAAAAALLPQLIAFGAHWIPSHTIALKSPLKQGLGLSAISTALASKGYTGAQFLLSDRYQNVAQLERYAPGEPRSVYFMNLWNIRMNHYSLRPFEPGRWLGKSGYFAAIIPAQEIDMESMRAEKYCARLSPYFLQVNYLGASPLTTPLGIPVRYLLLFYCSQYNGQPLPNTAPTEF